MKKVYRIYNRKNNKYIETDKISEIKYLANMYAEIDENFRIVELITTEREMELDSTNYKVQFYLDDETITTKRALELVGISDLEQIAYIGVQKFSTAYCETEYGTVSAKIVLDLKR